jgi:hypothetical protein
MEEEYPL